MKKFQELLRPLGRKIVLERFLAWLFYFGIGGGAGCLLAVLFSKWVEVPMLWLVCVVFLILSLLASLCCTFLVHPVHMKETAEKADALGGAERMITTLELLEKEDWNPVERLAVADGMQKAEETDFSKQYKLHLPKKAGICALVLLVLAGACSFLPVVREKETSTYAKAKLERIEQVKEETQQEDMTKEEKKAFTEVLHNLEKGLKKAKTTERAKEVVQETQKEMKRLEKKSISPDLRKLAETLSPYDKDMAKAMENGKAEEIAKKWEQLASLLSSMTAEEKAALAEKLGEAVEAMSDEELQKALEELEELLKNNGDLEKALDKVGKAAQKAASKGNAMRVGLQKANTALAQKGAEPVPMESQNSGQGKSDQGQSGQGQSGQGQSGQGQSGQRQGGNGAGAGGRGRGFGHGEHEKVFTRSAQGKSGTDVQLQGTDTENGSYTTTEQRITGGNGEVLPFGEVYGQYKNEAMTAIENQEIPYGMKELVSDYFSVLEQ